MSEKEQSPNGQDDFRKIKGIGDVTAQTLNKLGIRTYAELAQFTSARLVELLKGKIPALSLHRIAKDDWPSQARSLMNKTKKKPEEAQEKPSHRETWRELADFFISFGYSIDDQGREHLQTKVHHSQADKLYEWDGIASDQLIAWILKQANLPEPAPAEGQLTKAPLPSSQSLQMGDNKPVLMALSDVAVNEINAPEGSATGQPENILRIETQLTLPGGELLDETLDHAAYAVEVYLIDMQTHENQLVNTYSDYLSAGNQRYSITRDIKIPDAGRYQLILFARLLPPLVGIAQAQGPLIRVEA